MPVLLHSLTNADMAMLHERYGPMFRWRFLGRRTIYVGGSSRVLQASAGEAGLRLLAADRWHPLTSLPSRPALPMHKRRP